MKTHKDLDVWKRSIEFAKIIYSITSQFPDGERSGLISQMRRAVISLPSNIAEGAARNHNKEFIQFCYISLGSLAELETHLILVDKLNVAKIPDKVREELGEIRRMLIGLISLLERTK